MSNERDTHFKEFARKLWVEILQSPDFADLTSYNHRLTREQANAIELLIARRAFDLAEHVIKHQHGSNLDEMQNEGLAHFLEVSYPDFDRLPDMTAFPEEQS